MERPAAFPPGPSAQAPASETLIIGGGLAGAAAAIELARAGPSVTLLERDPAPRHKVCGEFLSAEALHLLHSLGLSPATLGAVPIHAVRLCSARANTEAALPFAALSLTRKRLDAALLEAAAGAGARVVRGAAVQTLTRTRTHWHATCANGHTYTAPHTILATGKHDLRNFPRPDGPQSDLVAMKMYFKLPPAEAAALAGHVDLLLYPGGYAGLQPVEDGAANLCTLIRRSVLAQLGGNWPALLAHILRHCPHAHDLLANAEPLLAKPLAVAPIPYGFIRSKPAGEQLWAVGDQAAVIPSFTGDGMSIALYTGIRAAQSLLAAESAAAFQRKLHRDLRFQVARATVISRAMVHPAARPALLAAATLCPCLLRWTAASTRLPASAMHHLQLAM